MPLFYNGQEVKKLSYNGQDVKKLSYNGQNVPIMPAYIWEKESYLIAFPGDEDKGVYLRRDADRPNAVWLDPVQTPHTCATPYRLYFDDTDLIFKVDAPDGIMIRNGPSYIRAQDADFCISLDPNNPLGLGFRDFDSGGCTGDDTTDMIFGLEFDPETSTFSGQSQYKSSWYMKAVDEGFQFQDASGKLISEVIRLIKSS